MQVQDIQTVAVGPDNAALQSKSLTGKWPVLEDVSTGVLITDGLPIARYLARDNTLFTSGQGVQQRKQTSSNLCLLTDEVADLFFAY